LSLFSPEKSILKNTENQTPASLLVPIAVAASLLGIATKTLRNWLSEKKCPIPQVEFCGRKMFRIRDINQYVDDLKPIVNPPVAPLASAKRRPGRPRNSEKRAVA